MEYIRIITKDRKGLLTEVSELVGQNGINILSIVTDRDAKAKEILDEILVK